MIWVLRVAAALAVTAYAGWLAWPLLAPFNGAAVEEAGQAAVALVRNATAPQGTLWIVGILFYLAAAALTLIGSGRAALVFLIGFMADVLLRLTIDQQGPGGPADIGGRAMEALAPFGLGFDPAPLTLAALAILGWLVYALDQRRARPGGRDSGPKRRSAHRTGPDTKAAGQIAA